MGIVAHLMADGLTKQGVPLLWPVSDNKMGLPIIASTTTGGYGETLYVALIAATSALYAARVIF